MKSSESCAASVPVVLLVEGSVLCLSSIGEFCLGGQGEVVGKRVNELLLCHMGLSISSDV